MTFVNGFRQQTYFEEVFIVNDFPRSRNAFNFLDAFFFFPLPPPLYVFIFTYIDGD